MVFLYRDLLDVVVMDALGLDRNPEPFPLDVPRTALPAACVIEPRFMSRVKERVTNRPRCHRKRRQKRG